MPLRLISGSFTAATKSWNPSGPISAIPWRSCPSPGTLLRQITMTPSGRCSAKSSGWSPPRTRKKGPCWNTTPFGPIRSKRPLPPCVCCCKARKPSGAGTPWRSCSGWSSMWKWCCPISGWGAPPMILSFRSTPWRGLSVRPCASMRPCLSARKSSWKWSPSPVRSSPMKSGCALWWSRFSPMP